MSGDTTSDLRQLVERLRAGDDSARRMMLDRAHDRLRRIAGAMLRKDFPRLRAGHDLDSVVNEAWARLVGAIETHPPESVELFYGLLFRKVRHVLLDLARARRPAGRLGVGVDGVEIADDSGDPALLALLTEFHLEVEKLPEAERLVFDLHYYGGFTQAEVARILNFHPRRVSRLWLAATARLAAWLDGIPEMNRAGVSTSHR
jgi:RNA polymerase sigma factor (sigma-70 family)